MNATAPPSPEPRRRPAASADFSPVDNELPLRWHRAAPPRSRRTAWARGGARCSSRSSPGCRSPSGRALRGRLLADDSRRAAAAALRRPRSLPGRDSAAHPRRGGAARGGAAVRPAVRARAAWSAPAERAAFRRGNSRGSPLARRVAAVGVRAGRGARVVARSTIPSRTTTRWRGRSTRTAGWASAAGGSRTSCARSSSRCCWAGCGGIAARRRAGSRGSDASACRWCRRTRTVRADWASSRSCRARSRW